MPIVEIMEEMLDWIGSPKEKLIECNEAIRNGPLEIEVVYRRKNIYVSRQNGK